MSQHWIYPTLVHCSIFARDLCGALAARVAEELARAIERAWRERVEEYARATHRVPLIERPWTAPSDVYDRAALRFVDERVIARALRNGDLLIADGGAEEARAAVRARLFRPARARPHACGTRRTTK